MALAIDASSPVAFSTSSAAAITSASFTPPSGSLIVVSYAANGTSAEDVSVTSVTNTGTGITWTRRARKNKNASSTGGAGTEGGAEIWTGVGTGGAITVTINGVGAVGGYDKFGSILVFTGADTTTFSVTAATSASGLPSVALAGCSAGSHVVAVSSDWAQLGNATAGTGQTIVAEYNLLNMISCHAWRTTSVLGGAGSQTMNLTAPSGQQYNLAVMEVRDTAASSPSVSAGADASTTVGVAFARTATEANLVSVSARNWEIVSGPAGAVSSIGTAAALSWTPATTGSYVLRYSATHSTGTATDDVAVTVINPTPTPVADRGSASNLTAQTTTGVTLTNPTLIAAGNYLLARVAVDNSGTNGAAPGCTVTDPRSNTWTVLGPALVDPGAAAAGATAYIAYAKVVTAYQAADALTFNWGGVSTTAKSVVVEEWQYIHATTPVAVTEVTATGTASAALSISITPTAADQAVYTCLAVEGPTGDTAPADADTTNGPWVALTRLATASGTAASNQTVSGAYKQVTASGAQTWDATITNRDWAAIAVVFAPSPAPTSSSPEWWSRRRGPNYRR